MTKPIERPPVMARMDPANPALANPAVARCCAALRRVALADLKEDEYCYTEILSHNARQAYSNLLPPLDSYQNICDFVACVTFGMAIQAISEDSASKLLYGAQVAFNTIGRPPKTAKPDLNPGVEPAAEPPAVDSAA
jgi:hypothetical protein